MTDPKADLHEYLRAAREALLWKLEGLSEYDVRRPLVPTGTNLLGLVKHLATVEWGHFGAAFGHPSLEALPWVEDENSEPDADKWATAEESREHSAVTLHRILVHTIAEAHRHAGHADIVRELIDGSAGLADGGAMLAGDAAWREQRRARLERVASSSRSRG